MTPTLMPPIPSYLKKINLEKKAWRELKDLAHQITNKVINNKKITTEEKELLNTFSQASAVAATELLKERGYNITLVENQPKYLIRLISDYYWILRRNS
ncbi:MAG TPA: hypothetical protein VJK25_02615 [Patescibacteria group bacterium]|nr:hypothetical protein [Patescibacteria group bacterium]